MTLTFKNVDRYETEVITDEKGQAGCVIVCHCHGAEREANAELICRAVNNHNSLLNACKVALSEGDDLKAIRTLKNAIAKAERNS